MYFMKRVRTMEAKYNTSIVVGFMTCPRCDDGVQIKLAAFIHCSDGSDVGHNINRHYDMSSDDSLYSALDKALDTLENALLTFTIREALNNN